MPTETVYGLAGNATSGDAVAAIFAAKGRPEFNPLIVHLPSVDEVRRLVGMDARSEALARAFWPGALTMVLPRLENCPVHDLASAGLPTLAVRVPAHPIAQALLRACGLPLAAPSANLSGSVSPTTAAHVLESLGDRIEAILDGGPCQLGLESTIVGLAGERALLLRPGGVESERIAAIIGPLGKPSQTRVEAPGMLASHYAPHATVRLNAREVRAGEALLAFGPAPPPGAVATLNLSTRGDLAEAATNLFAHLRSLDRSGAACIAVMEIPEHGLGLAINDRLRRAAAPR